MRKRKRALICGLLAALQLTAALNFGTVSAESDITVPNAEKSTSNYYDETNHVFTYGTEPAVTTAVITQSAKTTTVTTTAAKTTTVTTSAAAAKTTTATTSVPAKTTTATTASSTSAESEQTTSQTTTDAPDTGGWFRDESGRYFYSMEDGSNATGICEIDGQKYVFSDGGVLKTGWRTIDGKRYYFDPDTGKAVYGWIKYNNNDYYVAEDGKQTGLFNDSEGDSYFFNDKGILCKGNQFIYYDDSIFCPDDSGKLLKGEQTVDGVTYLFGKSGRLETGWRTIDGKRYYFDRTTGERKLGIITYNGKYYYVTAEDGKVSGIADINGISYIFDETYGNMLLGWQTFNNETHYYRDDATAAVGFTSIGNEKYYFNEKGVMLTGKQTIDGVDYYFDTDGKLLSGWRTINGKKYYYTTEGQLALGFMAIDGKLFYFDENNVYNTGWQTINGNLYYFDGDNGAMKGLRQFTTGYYYFGNDGKLLTGWQTVDGILRYFDPSSGLMVVNKIVDGYEIDANGVAKKLSDVQIRADKIIASIGNSADNIFTYVRSNNKYKFMEPTKSLSEIEALGWGYFANYAMDNRFIVCYYFAAITDLLMHQAGYETRIVYGTGRGTSDHYWNQVKINGVWVNYDTCNGYSNVNDDYLKEQNYTWKSFVYPKYN